MTIKMDDVDDDSQLNCWYVLRGVASDTLQYTLDCTDPFTLSLSLSLGRSSLVT